MTNEKPWKDLVEKGSDIHKPNRIPTGSLGLDLATGGGWPLERTVTFYGEYGTGKTTLAMLAIAEAQKLGYNCLFIDAENSFDDDYGSRNGIDIEKLSVVRSEVVDDLAELKDFIRERDIKVIVIDSITMLGSIDYFEEDNNSQGSNSRSVKNIARRFKRWNHPLLIQIAQTTMKWGANQPTYAVPTSGQYVGFSSCFIVKLHKGKPVKGKLQIGDMQFDGETLAQNIDWDIRKYKQSVSFTKGEFVLYRDSGIDMFREAISVAGKIGVIKKAGSYYEYDKIRTQGMPNFVQAMSENLEVFEEMKSEVLKRIER